MYRLIKNDKGFHENNPSNVEIDKRKKDKVIETNIIEERKKRSSSLLGETLFIEKTREFGKIICILYYLFQFSIICVFYLSRTVVLLQIKFLRIKIINKQKPRRIKPVGIIIASFAIIVFRLLVNSPDSQSD